MKKTCLCIRASLFSVAVVAFPPFRVSVSFIGGFGIWDLGVCALLFTNSKRVAMSLCIKELR